MISELTADLREAYRVGLARIDAGRAVRDALLTPSAAWESAVESRVGRCQSVRLLSVGKAAPAMAEGALAAFRRKGVAVEATLVIAPDGTPVGPGLASATVLRAAHPLPDERSVAAAEAALSFVASGRPSCVVAAISGGASALLAAPVGVPLEEKMALTAALLASGADIRAINTVRRHLSLVKGGGLARAASPRPVLSILVSDVLGGAAFDIASGPTVPDPTTTEDARRILDLYAPAFASLRLRETLKPWHVAARRLAARIVLDPGVFAARVADALAERGYRVATLAPAGDDVATLAAGYLSRAAALAPGAAFLRAAEPTVRVAHPSPGRGGRSGHLAALVARELASRGLSDVAFLAGASDGVDGSSGAAGAVVDGVSAAGRGEEATAAIEAFRTADLHAAWGTALPSTPTGQNLADVHILARAKP